MTERIQEVNEEVLRGYFARLDPLVSKGTSLYLFGGGAVALLGAKIRTTIDLDVAAPYSTFSESEFAKASEQAGLPVNPPLGYQGAYVEFVQPLMLALPRPTDEECGNVIFRGLNLMVKTCSPADLVASKLCRYNAKDRGDVQFLVESVGVTIEQIHESVKRLPPRLRDDVLVQENLSNLEVDMKLWRV